MGIELWLFEGGYLFQHMATFFQILKMLKRQNSECVSLETNILFLIGALSRIGWMWDSMLKTFTLAYIEIFLAIGTLTYAIYLFQINKVRNYYSNVIQLPIFLKLYFLIPLITILSLFFNPGDNWFSSQFFVAFGIYSEAFGLIPQLYIIKKSKDAGDLSELYIVFLGIARFFRLFFWIQSYIQGNNFLSLMVADVIHTIALSNFIYNVIKNWSGNGLPTSFAELSGNSPKKMF
jgi:ER lumen protein retaining receptor